MIVLCTHGHIDHAGGAFGFETVFLNEKDGALAKVHTSVEFRKANTESGFNPITVSPEDYVPQRRDYLNLIDGQVFDLGGISVSAAAFPGHTQGMTCILINELRVMILGDGCNPFTFLFLPEACSVEQYRANLQHFLGQHEDKYDVAWLSHGPYKVPKTIVNECIEVCDDILAGRSDAVPFNFWGQKALIAKAISPSFARVDGKWGNIVYNPERVLGK